MLTTPARGAQANFGSELSQIPGRVHAGQPPSTSHRSTGSKQSGSSIEYIDDDNELRSIGRAQMACRLDAHSLMHASPVVPFP